MKTAFLVYPILLALALAAGAQSAPGPMIIPNPAPAGQEFRLYLHTTGCTSCAYTYPPEPVAVKGNRIDLRYVIAVPRPNPGAAESGPIQSLAGGMPAFSMPPLPAGRYEVWATQVPACLIQMPLCEIAEPVPFSAGELEVRSDVQAAYILNPSSAPAENPFDLQLLSGGYSCATAFDSLSAAVYGDTIALTFYDWELPKGCAVAYELYGPTFHLPALPAKTYRVKVNRLAKKTVADVGPLRIIGAVPILPLSPALSPAVRSRAAWRGFEVVFDVPREEAGIWQAELLSPDGRIRGRTTFLWTAGEKMAVAPERRPAKGLYLLRLTAPAGTQHYLEIAQ
jgi:hypothetical protein